MPILSPAQSCECHVQAFLGHLQGCDSTAAPLAEAELHAERSSSLRFDLDTRALEVAQGSGRLGIPLSQGSASLGKDGSSQLFGLAEPVQLIQGLGRSLNTRPEPWQENGNS